MLSVLKGNCIMYEGLRLVLLKFNIDYSVNF